MVSADRQLIMETNRSLRNIKTELENLLEKGVIDEGVFDRIHAALPPESSLSGPLRTTSGNASTTAARESPAPAAGSTASPAPPTQQLQNLGMNNSNPETTTPSPGPPSYDQTPAPSLPSRSAKPILAHARALYRYVASDNRDVSFEKDDQIVVYQYMNQDWWMGQNTRTSQEGIFPRNYVLVEHEEKKSAYVPYPQPQYGYPPAGQGPPQQQNPYSSSVPPMAVAEGGQPANGQQQQGDSKVGEYGKKFGKKLGNAAIFGAGATIGGNIVNSIF
ncbi:SH3 domain containing protein [Metarhizium album ARSEF 1941]|uniref:SH3 domain containing protein n=1 Tax=Metarhizium album (strain ARSEF 1941) TaxID=1081103 RepID=A0A0B2WRJ5_METAS|nr:SH3 domain containing protein [Metarhizium album ARSEF 1941]KHN98681.1 SH3 domain containing protein [Metarhizium album ARSEF 1941]